MARKAAAENDCPTGTRVLFTSTKNGILMPLREAVVTEWSPSKKFVKVGRNWHDASLVEIEEVLPATPPEPVIPAVPQGGVL